MGREPLLRLTWSDPSTGIRGFAVIDRLVGGVSGGGMRMRKGCTLAEVERLARTMSYKNGALQVPSGGAKGGIDCDPHAPESRDVLLRFVHALKPILSTIWSTAEDLGVQQDTLDSVFAEAGLTMSSIATLRATGDAEAAIARMRAGLRATSDGIPLADLVGGYGVAEAAAAAMESRSGTIQGASAVVQGFGSMGGASARYLDRLGARVVGIIDAQGAIANPNGLDVEALLLARNSFGEVDRGALRDADTELPRDDWLDIEADVLVPAAVGDAITIDNCHRVHASVIVEAANFPVTEEAEQALTRRGIMIVPDFVANASANGWWYWTLSGLIGPEPEEAFSYASKVMRDAVADLVSVAKEHGVESRRAAQLVAERNLDDLEASGMTLADYGVRQA